MFIKDKTLDSTWFALLKAVYENGRTNQIEAGSYAGNSRLEFDFVSGTIEYPTTRPLAPIMPDGVPPVTTDEDIEKYFINYIMDGHNLAKNEHYRYATWITGGRYKMPQFSGWQAIGVTDSGEKKWHKIYTPEVSIDVPNQTEWLIKHYKEKGFGNNHCYIQVGYPESNFAYDMPYENESERQTSPCLRGIDTHIKNNKLHVAVIFRSWDLYGAWPENMGGITLWGEYVASELDIEMGPLSFASLKLHAYDFQIEAVKARLGVKDE